MEGAGQEGSGAPAPGAPQGPRPSNKRLQQTQAQVDEVVGIMKVNVEKVLERDQKLSQLDDRADALQQVLFNKDDIAVFPAVDFKVFTMRTEWVSIEGKGVRD
ncbi:unnamed protein product [Toxocara canis]|uniref:V-SNARE coiled-coil homology domain-containing protein n=1 Tax=Toxocara canis TaxID=6265 RepID=A0A183UGK3_TOXCA|nr:unnamed protein product [Toxocara canis]